MVVPALDLELPDTEAVGSERRRPAIVAQWLHPDLGPASRTGPAVSDHGADRIVTVAEDIGLDRNGLTKDPLDRESATVHPW